MLSLESMGSNNLKHTLEMAILQNYDEAMSKFAYCIGLGFDCYAYQLFNLSNIQSLFLVEQSDKLTTTC